MVSIGQFGRSGASFSSVWCGDSDGGRWNEQNGTKRVDLRG